MQTVGRYTKEEAAEFPGILGAVTLALEEERRDHLGEAFHELELGSKWAGQFFTPQHLCDLMAGLTLSDEDAIKAKIAEQGYITMQEPAVGAGACVIGAVNALHNMGINYQRHLHVTAIDIDARAAHMAYIQLSLLHVPAVVIVGNTLTLEMREAFYTPAHIMGGWSWKLKRPERTEPAPAPQLLAPVAGMQFDLELR